MVVDYTALRPGTLIHGGGIGLIVEVESQTRARVMSLAPEDIGQIRTWGAGVIVISEPRSDIDAAMILRAYNVAGLMEPMATVHVKNTEAVWAEYTLAVTVPARLLQDDAAILAEARDRIEAGDFTTLAGPDIRASITGVDQEYELIGVDQ